MTTATAINWNAWRSRYDEMTFADQVTFYDLVFDDFPEQGRFSTRVLGRLLEGPIGDEVRPLGWSSIPPLSVVELGGWNGGFASEILPEHPEIRKWRNYEVSAAAVAATVCEDGRYQGIALRDWYWAEEHSADIFVASHVLEHLKLRDVLATFDATDARWLYLQAPLGEEATDWTNYRGSHILEVGWRVLGEELNKRGFDLIPGISEPWARCFERRS